MNLDEYKHKRSLYDLFAMTVGKILQYAITDANENGFYKYNLQQIQSRAKTYESLEKRLSEKREIKQ